MYIPTEPIAVAVVRWLGGNHMLERAVEAACATGPPIPITIWPIWIRYVPKVDCEVTQRKPVPRVKQKLANKTVLRKPMENFHKLDDKIQGSLSGRLVYITLIYYNTSPAMSLMSLILMAILQPWI